ncbi:hypothetical protein PTKIN_Ptkin14bG0170200 [Pterospermum kingtungense]
MGRVIRILCLVLAFLHFMVDSSWSFSSSFLPSSHLCLPDQGAALLQFKSTISLYDDCEMYPKTNSWNKSIDCCSWEGVSCNDETGDVIGVDLSYSCLNGSLPANNGLFHLHSLQWLDLSSNWLDGSPLENSSLFHVLQGLQRLNLADNSFNGSISSELFSQSVSLTHLNLSYNEFSELIPHEISLLSNLVSLDLSGYSSSSLRFDARGFDMLARNLTKLRTLGLDSVDMSGVPVTSFLNLTSSLEYLSLRGCDLNGEFPSQVFQLPYLHHIDLRVNENLTGYLPKTNLSSALMLLDLSYCGFRGSIPASFGNLTEIISIDLYGNGFERQIPDVFGNLKKLTSLRFSSCNFSGQLPITMFSLTQITFLDLSYNQLSGQLPTVFNLTKITQLDLSDNQLSGQLPITLFNLTKITQLHLSDNQLEGSLPNHVGELQLLEGFYLSNNFVSGGVPSWLFTLPSLQSLDLSYNKLTASIDKIDQRPNSVQSVDLSSNGIHGPIPNSFFDLVNITSLDLSSNNLSGVIKPDMLSKLESLKHLDLSKNTLLSLSTSDSDSNYSFPSLDTVSFASCSIRQFPNFFRKSSLLRSLDLSNNNISGNIPSLICNWTSVVILDLSNNSLTGTIPDCLGNFSDSLEDMNLQMNKFYGKIPDSFMNNSLRNLFLNDNQLEGLVPPSLGNCGSLEILNLGNNMLTDTFPHWLASLPSLQILVLRSNRLHGALPSSPASSDFSGLRILDLSLNEFTSSLPAKFFRNLRAMKDAKFQYLRGRKTSFRCGAYNRACPDLYYQTSMKVRTKGFEIELVKTLDIFIAMDFSNNLFSGQIPEELGELISLQMLNFSHNNFTGPIPTSFGNLVQLESLDLSSNKLGGEIPSQLTNLTFLEVLNLSENDLVGPIPHGNQFGTFDNDSYSGNLGLCGFPLSKQCNPEGPNPPPPKFKDEGSGIAFIWKLAMMGYGCGMVLGLSAGYIVLTTGRPWWFVRMVERDLQGNVTKWIRRIQGRRN